MSAEVIADDLFAGAGGWDVAANRLGIRPRGVENMKEARATRDAAGLETIHDDVWTYQPDGAATGLIASPPCQTFSQAGKGAGRKALEDVFRGVRDDYVSSLDHLSFLGEEVGDDRTALVLTPLHFALAGGYEWLAFEQVPTVLPVWEACAERLRVDGWSAWTGLLHSEQYGVPQTRKRAFLLASRHGMVVPPLPTHSRYYSRKPEARDFGVLDWVSMAEALGWGCSGECTQLRNNNTANAAVRSAATPAPTLYFGQRCNFCAWEQSGASLATTNVHDGVYQARPVCEPASTITAATRSFRWGMAPMRVESPGKKGGNMHENRVTGDVLPDWCYRRPSTTIVGRFKPEIVAAPGSVRVTVQEAGVLQSFPADYPWQGAKGKQFLQCGNAVPPLMAAAALSSVAGITRSAAA